MSDVFSQKADALALSGNHRAFQRLVIACVAIGMIGTVGIFYVVFHFLAQIW